MSAAIRAVLAKDIFSHVHRFRPDAEAAFRAAVGDVLVRTVDEASRMAWLPYADFARVADAACAAVGGHVAYQALWREAVVVTARSPAFEALVASMLRLFGASPGNLVRQLPRALDLAFKDCGTWSASPESAQPRLNLRVAGFPNSPWSEAYVHGLAGAMQGIGGMTGKVCAARVVSMNPAAGEFDVELTWT